MEFRIADTFTDSLARLTGDEQKAVKTTAFGSIETGKRADLILVNTSDINMGPFTDPAYMLVDSAQPWNVETVMVDGRILKRNGKLTAIDTGTLMAEASKASREVRDRAKWW